VTMTVERLHKHLPIFSIRTENERLLYTAGMVSQASVGDVDSLRRHWLAAETLPDRLAAFARELRDHAEERWRLWTASARVPYRPERLIVHLGNACMLACDYCYSAHRDSAGRRHRAGEQVSLEAVIAAAKVVAANCRDRGIPLRLALHGGGEPTVDARHMEACVGEVRRTAREFGIGLDAYLATNGQMPRAVARRLAGLFHRVGLSCDGLPELHDRQRPRWDGARSSEALLQTAQTLAQYGIPVEVRATVTPDSVDLLPDIAAYACHALHADTVRVEPRFGDQDWPAPIAASFAKAFLSAASLARSCGAELVYAGLRLTEIHGPYCDTSRQVLRLLPDGAVSACFLGETAGLGGSVPAEVGRYRAKPGGVVLDMPRVEWFQRRHATIPAACQECPAVLHCARGCPGWCAAQQAPIDPDSFRCRLHRELLVRWLLESLGPGNPQGEPSPWVVNRVKTYIDEIVPARIRQKVSKQWDRGKTQYPLGRPGMPRPGWMTHGFSIAPDKVWPMLLEEGETSKSPALSIYVHVPFCARRCGFCDCRASRIVPRHLPRQADGFVETLTNEISRWSRMVALARKPVTTVHFGGGTPDVLGPARLDELIAAIRGGFAIHPATEWAIETTEDSLTDEHIAWLRERFSRLHVGVQTLEEPLRQAIGRPLSAAETLARLQRTLAEGFVTSCDVVYDLPGQSITSYLRSLTQLLDAGIHGISCYRFNRSSRNVAMRYRLEDAGCDSAKQLAMFAAS
jgi:uncharacterized protein